MPDYLKMMSYQYITNLKSNKIKKKSILIIGAGYMAEQYSESLKKMDIRDVTVIGNSKNKVKKLCKKYDFFSLDGGFQKNLSKVDLKDLVIIATPIPLLIPASKLAIKFGQRNILLEKPGDLKSTSLESLQKNSIGKKIHLAYNRLFYPSYHKLLELSKIDGGITSCTFTFTEWTHKINFNSYSKSVLSRWGISNSLHVVSMVMRLIGMPKTMKCFQKSPLSWHKSGSIFVGAGISNKNIPFSYNSDWNSAGRWGIDVMTRKNSYRLMPLEKLYRCKKGSINWENIPLKKSFPKIKDGIAEEIFSMLDVKPEIDLVTLKEGSSYIKLAEKIFNYK